MQSVSVPAGVRVATGLTQSGERRSARALPRMPHRVPCRLCWHDPASDAPASCVGQTVNISHAGIAVQLGREIPAGTRVEALLPHANNEITHVNGTVARTRRVLAGTFEIGIEFRRAVADSSEDAPIC